MRLELISIKLTKGFKPNKTKIDKYRPNESKDLQTITRLINSYITHKGIYIACLPFTLLAL
jgi:ribosomal protein S17E